VALAAGAAIVVDVRSPDAYTLSHITGSINIPLGEIELNAGGLSLDREQWIITYCT
jgi:rhodanese-related sulfurtransferase